MWSGKSPNDLSGAPGLALEEARSIHTQGEGEAQRDLEREDVAAPPRAEARGRWSRRRRVTVALIVVALATAITGVVAISIPPRVPPIPAYLPVPAGTVFPLEIARNANGTPVTYNGSFVYVRDFNGSANGTVSVPAGQCILLQGGWRATVPTFALGASADGMNGTMKQLFLGSSFQGGAIHFSSLQPDTITVTQTIQYIAAPCM